MCMCVFCIDCRASMSWSIPMCYVHMLLPPDLNVLLSLALFYYIFQLAEKMLKTDFFPSSFLLGTRFLSVCVLTKCDMVMF